MRVVAFPQRIIRLVVVVIVVVAMALSLSLSSAAALPPWTTAFQPLPTTTTTTTATTTQRSAVVVSSLSWMSVKGARTATRTRLHRLAAVSSSSSTPGADIEQPPSGVVVLDDEARVAPGGRGSAGADATSSMQLRGKFKVNEIDFCIAPADASLSRAYGTTYTTSSSSSSSSKLPSSSTGTETAANQPLPSLTRALNNASNRAVRRILLARSWPSAEALNLSLRQVAAAERAAQQQQAEATISSASASFNNANDNDESSSPKCPVPRPILNVLTRKRGDVPDERKPRPRGAASLRGRTDEEYVADQLKAFRERYGSLPGYNYAEAYLDSILSLATSGVESVRALEVLDSGIYDDAYRRIKAVLRTAGVEFVVTDENPKRTVIAKKLIDQDICLSMMDKLNMQKEAAAALHQKETALASASATAVSNSNKEVQEPQKNPTDTTQQSQSNEVRSTTTNVEKLTDAKQQKQQQQQQQQKPQRVVQKVGDAEIEIEDGGVEVFIPKLRFFAKRKAKEPQKQSTAAAAKGTLSQDDDGGTDNPPSFDAAANSDSPSSLTKEDLGGVLLSAEEPTMTRQLNVLSNIVQRALLFGGDQELLVLSETLDADRAAFIERWYGRTGDDGGGVILLMPVEDETRPGVQFLNALVALLRKCYNDGIVTDLQPPVPTLGQSYKNAYERLVATAVELGSGYLKPVASLSSSNNVMTMPSPRTATEELGRFAVWETTFRQRRQSSKNKSAHPQDLQGKWEVRDEIGGETIGVSVVQLLEDGQVDLAQPMEGLRWRCDPGPTHLDTVTFQALSSDGTILQYRGFIDRGARLEARVSKRPLRIRGSVMFQMRDGSVDYFKDMLPINYRQGTTKFAMTKLTKEAND